MAEKRLNPAESFRELITEWERKMDSAANKVMGTSEFSRTMNQLQDLQLSMQKRFNDAMADRLSRLNMPTREDVLRLGRSMRALDKRLARIEQLLEEQAPKKRQSGAGNPSRPPRTKAPPGRPQTKSRAASRSRRSGAEKKGEQADG